MRKYGAIAVPIALAASIASFSLAQAQLYPSRPITMVVGIKGE